MVGAQCVSGVLVGLASNVRAFCPKTQLSDNTNVKKVASLFPVGTSVKCRVLSNTLTDGKRQLIVTHKKSLIDSALPALASYADAQVGAAYHGYLMSVKSNGCVVKFFNNIQAFIPRVHLSALEDIAKPEEHFHVGQTVKAFILSVDVSAGRMMASLKPGAVNAHGGANDFSALTVGSLVDVVVSERIEQGLLIPPFACQSSSLQAWWCTYPAARRRRFCWQRRI